MNTDSTGILRIETAENGFIAYDQQRGSGMTGKQWAFESPKTLADFIRDWAQGNTKTESGKTESKKEKPQHEICTCIDGDLICPSCIRRK